MHHVIILLLAYRDIICIVCFYPSVKPGGGGTHPENSPSLSEWKLWNTAYGSIDSTAAPVSAPDIKDVVVTCDFFIYFLMPIPIILEPSKLSWGSAAKDKPTNQL